MREITFDEIEGLTIVVYVNSNSNEISSIQAKHKIKGFKEVELKEEIDQFLIDSKIYEPTNQVHNGLFQDFIVRMDGIVNIRNAQQ